MRRKVGTTRRPLVSRLLLLLFLSVCCFLSVCLSVCCLVFVMGENVVVGGENITPTTNSVTAWLQCSVKSHTSTFSSVSMDDLRSRLTHLVKDFVNSRGRFADSLMMAEVKKLDLGLSTNFCLVYSTDPMRLVEEVMRRAEKSESSPDYRVEPWGQYFEHNLPPACTWEAISQRLDVRERFNYTTLGELPQALRYLWTACYCWGEVAAALSAAGVRIFSQQCFEIFKLFGSRYHLLPIMGDLLSKLEWRTRATSTPILPSELDELIKKGYTCYFTRSREVERSRTFYDSLVLHPFVAPCGVPVPGAILNVNETQRSREASTTGGTSR